MSDFGLTLCPVSRNIPPMKLIKSSKTLVGVVLCGSMLSAYSDTTPSALSSTAFDTPRSSLVQAQSTPDNSSLWVNMSRSFVLNHEVNQPAVQQQIAWLQKHQDALYKLLQNSAPYITYVYGQTRQHGLPGEIALLPVVESGFNPNAKSPVGASGLWQIMPKTAPGLGLTTNQAYDGCRDIIASTTAALNYLNSLNHMFKNDWELALAAYNWGPGSIRNAIKGQVKWYQKPSYWKLKMPAETQGYVPKLLALAEVIQNPGRYNIKLPTVSARPTLASVKVAPKMDLKKIAAKAGISVQTIQKLNPGYKQLATTASSPNKLLLPIDKAQVIQAKAPELAANVVVEPEVTTVTAKTADLNTLPAVTQGQDTGNTALLNAILKEGQWLVLGLANIPSLDAEVMG